MAAFATAAELFQRTGGEAGGGTARATAMLDQASALIRSYTGQTLSAVVGDVYSFEATVSSNLYLPEVPVTAVSLVEVDGEPFTDFGFTPTGRLYRDGPWLKGATATYDHGYAANSEEMAAIKSVCLGVAVRAFVMTGRRWDERFDTYGNRVDESAGFPAEVFLSMDEKRMLDRFALVSVA